MWWRLAVLIVLGVPGCSLLRPGPPPVTGGVQVGIASWYGPGFHGRRTASGERYDQWAFTAAHRTLPIGTRVRVTSLENGRTVEVRINDRGPFVRGRVIDLSRAAAERLRLTGPGLMEVRIEVLDTRRAHNPGREEPCSRSSKSSRCAETCSTWPSASSSAGPSGRSSARS